MNSSRFRSSARLRSPSPDFSFYDFTQLRDMTGMAKPTVVSKDSFIGTVHPHFGFDTYPQRGCSSFQCGAFGGLRGGLPSRTPGTDSSRQPAVDFVASASHRHRRPRYSTAQGADRVGDQCISQFLLERANESSGVSRSKYRAQFDSATCYCFRRGELRQSAERRFRADGAPEVSKPQAEAAWGVVDSPRLDAHRHQWSAKPDSRARKAGSGHHERP